MPGYGSTHTCEVSKSDLSRAIDDLRYDLERKIDDLRGDIRQLERRLESVREDVYALYQK